MITNHTELIMRRRNAGAFRDADEYTVTFVRDALPEKTAAGGYRRSTSPGPTVPPQRVRIVHNTRRYKNGLVNAESGDIPQTDYLLLGPHTLNVEENDKFVWDGPDGKKNYKITGVHPWREESILCSIEFDGPDNRNG